MNELMGFTIVPNLDSDRSRPKMTINRKYIRLSLPAVAALASEFVNVFIDEKTRRVMVKAAAEDTPNCYHLSLSGGPAKVRNSVIGINVVRTVTGVLGRGTFSGYLPEGTTGMIIFEANG